MSAAIAALVVGTVLAIGALAYVLYPIFFPAPETAVAAQETVPESAKVENAEARSDKRVKKKAAGK